MKRLTFLLLFSVASFSFSQVKIWDQSTVLDFSAGARNDVIITPDGDGALMLRPSLKKTGNDSIVAPVTGIRSYNDSGNYILSWVAAKRVLAQKFNAADQPLTYILTVDDSARASNSGAPVSLLNDGSFCIVWSESYQLPSGYYRSLAIVQFFSSNGIRLGNNVKLFAIPGTTPRSPRVIADQTLQRYLILASVLKALPGEVTQTTEAPILGCLYESGGKLIRDTIVLNSKITALWEDQPRGICNNGTCILTWAGAVETYGYYNIFVGTYNSDLEQIRPPIRINGADETAYAASLAMAPNGVMLIGWVDTRFGEKENIFCQLLNANGIPIGSEFMLKDLSTATGIYLMNSIRWAEDAFEIRFYDHSSTLWQSRWKYDPVIHGKFESSVFNTGSEKVNYVAASWNGPSSPFRRLSLQLRSAHSPGGMDTAQWFGPTSSVDAYLTGTGTSISPRHNGNRYIQYRVLFDVDTIGASPVLNDVSISYMPADTIPPVALVLTKAAGEHRRIVLEWQRSASSDVERCRIERLSDTLWTRDISATATSFIDSSVSAGTHYIYRVYALDSARNVSSPAITPVLSPTTRTLYVSSTGRAGATGSFSDPYSTIVAAIDYAGPFDTLQVLPGEYSGVVTVKDHVLLNGSGAAITTFRGAITAAVKSTVSNFTLIGENCVTCAGDSVQIKNNIMQYQGTAMGNGINCGTSSGTVIAKNIITGFSDGVYNGMRENSGCIVRNNIITCWMGILNRGTATIVNNTIIVGTTSFGISNQFGTISAINNCIACYPTTGQYAASISGTTGNTARYNDRWSTGDNAGYALQLTEISADPIFVSLAKNNVHYRPSSPCIDAGDPDRAYADADGSRNDIGAYGGPDPLPPEMSIVPITRFALSNIAAVPGDTVTFSVTMNPATGLTKAGFVIEFDSLMLQYRKTQTTSLTATFAVNARLLDKRRVSILLEGDHEIASGTGDVCRVSFLVSRNALPQQRTSLQLSGVWVSDSLGSPLFVESTTSGALIILDSASTPHHIYVDAAYTGTEQGTLRSPFATIQKAIAAAVDGDTVIVGPGSYDGTVTMRTGVFVKGSGATTSSISVPNNALITNPAVVRFSNVTRTGISGFSLINDNTLGRVIEISGSDAIVFNNRIDQGPAAADYVTVFSPSTVTISGNLFVKGRGGLMSMIAAMGLGCTVSIANNEFYSQYSQTCISISNSATASVTNNLFMAENKLDLVWLNNAKKTLISNNLFLDASTGCNGVNASAAESLIVANNVFNTTGMGVMGKNSRCVVVNNVIQSASKGISADSLLGHRYNLFWSNAVHCTPGLPDSTELIANPLFNNPANGDFRLSAGSPAKDRGDPNPQWNDRDGSRNDIGAYGGPLAGGGFLRESKGGIAIGSISCRNGDTAVVSVYGWGFGGMKELHIVFSFENEKLDLIALRPSQRTADCSITRKNIGSSLVECTIQSALSLPDDSTEVLALAFVVRRSTQSDVSIRFAGGRAVNALSQEFLIEENSSGLISVTVGVENVQTKLPESFALYQNYPNPFNPMTTVSYDLPSAGKVTLMIYDVLGRLVMRAAEAQLPAGHHTVTLDCGHLSSGVYFYVCRMGEGAFVKKMMLLR